jgi:hypothetical protein
VNVDSVRYNETIHDFIPLDAFLCFTRCQVAQADHLRYRGSRVRKSEGHPTRRKVSRDPAAATEPDEVDGASQGIEVP